MRKLSSYEQDLVNRLQDKDEAASYLTASLQDYLEDNDSNSFALSLYYIVLAQGGVKKMAEHTGLNRENLHKIFKGQRKPKLETLSKLIYPDFEIIIRPKENIDTQRA